MTPDSLVRATETLLSLPDVVLRINQLIDDPATQPGDLAAVIGCDPGLSARLLRLVNSALYAQTEPVETITQAIRLIGFRALRDLAMATSAAELFPGLPPDKINMEHFWLHGVTCGLAAQELARRGGRCASERLFVTGLLHGVGRLVFVSQCAEGFREVLRLVTEERLDSIAAEEHVFGFNHVALGAALLRAWRFPESIWTVVAGRLDPTAAGAYRTEAEILQVAERVAHQVAATTIETGEATLAEVADVAAALRALAEQWSLDSAALLDLPQATSLQAMEVLEILRPGSTLLY